MRLRELQANADELRLLFEKNPEGIILVAGSGVIRFLNPAAEVLFGREASSLVGEMFGFPLLVGDTAELDIARPNGESAIVELRVVETRWDDETVLMASLRDVTARKQVEQSKLVAQREGELNRAKSDFLAGMSHELRTPLTAILGYSELLKDEAEKRALTDFGEDLDKITKAGQHLLGLITDILDLSEIEAGKVELRIEPFGVAELIDEIVANTQPLVRQRGNTLEVKSEGELAEMVGDQTKVRQVLYNLLSNAAKFTENGRITLTTTRETMEGGDWLTFVVSDTGIGMNIEQLTQLFTAFSQADQSTTRKYDGIGLGMAISRQLCQMMGGDIRVQSTPGEGSTFTMRLPAKVQEAKRKEAKSAAVDTPEQTGMAATEGPLG